MINASSSLNLIKNMAIEMPETQSPQQQRIRICSVRQAVETCRTFCSLPATLLGGVAAIATGGGTLTIQLVEKASLSSIIGATATAAIIAMPVGILLYKGLEFAGQRVMEACNDRDFRRNFTIGMSLEDQRIALEEYRLINALPKYSLLEQMPPAYENPLLICEQEGLENPSQTIQSTEQVILPIQDRTV